MPYYWILNPTIEGPILGSPMSGNPQEGQAGEAAELADARDKMEQEGLQWKAETEDLYLASVDYGAELNTSVDKTFEA